MSNSKQNTIFLTEPNVIDVPNSGYWNCILNISYNTKTLVITNGYGEQYLNWFTGEKWVGWKPVSVSNYKKHPREVIKTDTIYNFISNKLKSGYTGGEIELVGTIYTPSDSYNGNQWGVIDWIKSSSNIISACFYLDRSINRAYRSIVPSENFDTGWKLYDIEKINNIFPAQNNSFNINNSNTANVLFYNFSEENWCGMGVEPDGTLAIRVGINNEERKIFRFKSWANSVEVSKN